MDQLTPADLRADHAGEARILDLRVAERLGYERPRAVRQLIERNIEEFARYGELATRRGDFALGLGGVHREREYWLNELQAALVCLLSRTERAADVREEILRTWMTWRQQRQQQADDTRSRDWVYTLGLHQGVAIPAAVVRFVRSVCWATAMMEGRVHERYRALLTLVIGDIMEVREALRRQDSAQQPDRRTRH